MADNIDKPKTGFVSLVGAGPGDADLLTIRAHRCLMQATVVCYDALVGEGVLALVPEQTRKVYVGKRRSVHHFSQEQINQTLVQEAQAGERVVRLKGGDPYVFGRGGEEAEALIQANIAFEVVPGITAATGCSLYAGIPLTHREYAQSVSFITGHQQDGKSDTDWESWARPGKTLVFYMGMHHLQEICTALISHGASENLPAALIAQGTTIRQQVIRSTLANLPARVAEARVKAPTLIIVGEVAALDLNQ